MEDSDNKQRFQGRFGLPTVVVAGLLLGIFGFGLGLNIDDIDVQRYAGVNEELPEQLDYTAVDELYDNLRNKYAGQLSEQELMEGLKKGLIDAADDPFTEYLNADEAQELRASLNGEFEGIGAEIGIREEQLVIIAPLDGTPADEAGLRPQDAIVAIDDEDTSGLSIQEAVNRIRGDEGTDVALTIIRDDQAPEEVVITRGQIEIPSVEWEMLEDDIGYIELLQFGSDSTAEFQRAARELEEAGAEGIVLDVRGNPGGYLDAAVAITSEFLEAGKVVVEERRNNELLDTELARSGGALRDVPVVVLVNEGSASSSEIIAGALSDNGRAVLVGQQTFGKGSVQELVNLVDESVLRVTIANWHTPDGRNINEEGIEPDEIVEMTEEDIENDRDPQLERALELLQE